VVCEEARSPWLHWLTKDPAEWPLRRLFWASRVPDASDATDPVRVTAVLRTILEEGSAADWRYIRWETVRPLWDTLRVHPLYQPFWTCYWREMDAVANRDRVLDEEQHRVLRAAATILAPLGFELAGGTALAAGYLGHRLSGDLDLSSGPLTPSDWDAAHAALSAAWTSAGLTVRAEVVQKSFARFWVGNRPVKVEVAQDSQFRLAPASRAVDGMPVRSLQDLAADKTLALFGRATTRDFVDVYMLLQRFELSQMIAWARQKDPGFNRDWFIRSLIQVERANPTDVVLLVEVEWEQLRRTFRQAAIRLDHAAREEAEAERG